MFCNGKFFHTWLDWSRVEGECKETRKCSNCSKKETRNIPHDYSEWEFISDDDCSQERVCRRCGLKQTREGMHSFDEDWRYADPASCTSVCQCSRCKRFKVKYDRHVWGEWRYSDDLSCMQVRICQRCKDKEYRMADHQWTNEPSTYSECLSMAIDMLQKRIDENNLYKENLVGQSTSDSSNVRELVRLTNQNDRLNEQIMKYRMELQNQRKDAAGVMCTRCGAVKNLGIGKEDLSRIVEEEH